MTEQSSQPPTDLEFLASPQDLPSILPTLVYSTGQATWTPQELQTLHAALAQYPLDHFDNVTRYIKIAATLPRKCVRDVAFKVKTLECPSGRSATGIKRMKIEPYQERNQHTTATAELEEAGLAALLQDNMLALNTMRTNLLNGRIDENCLQMLKFRTNCETVLSALSGICTSIPPLPLQLDTSLIDGDNGDTNNRNSISSNKTH